MSTRQAVELPAMAEMTRSLPASPQTVAAYLAVLDAARRRGAQITRTKIAKLLYLADLRAVEDGHSPVSGVEWKWLDHGPYNNDLLFLENELVAARVVTREREQFYGGWILRAASEDSFGYDIPPEDMAILAAVVGELGNLAATTLKDMSYQTSPMVDAQKRGRGVTLNLELARRLPTVRRSASRMAAVLRSLPVQEDDEGVHEDLVAEIAELAASRRRANGAMLGD